MDKRILGVLSGVSALALLAGAAVASPAPEAEVAQRLKPAESFGDLLDPIPNAMSVLKAEDARADQDNVQVAQLYDEDGGGYYHHHHHHHHHYRRYYRVVPGFGFYGPHHHHHHHHHHHYRRFYDYND